MNKPNPKELGIDLALFIPAGYIAGAHGIRGEIILVPQINDPNKIESILDDGLILAREGVIKKFEVDKLRPHKNGYLVVSPQIPDRNMAETLKSHTWVLPKDRMVSESSEKIFLHEIEGFNVVDKSLGELGRVVGFSSNGPQDLIEVEFKGKKVSIPLIKAFLLKIDFLNKTIHMDLPSGLLDE